MGLVISALADPVFVKDEQHQFVLLNDALCAFLGKSHDELLGKSDYDFFPKVEADVFWEHDDRVFSTGEVDENEEQITDSAGAVHWISTRKSLLRAPDGRKFLVGIIRDITPRLEMERERRRIEDQMQHAQRLESLGVLAGGIAHDFNNLIAGILANVTMIREQATEIEPVLGPSVDEPMADIEESARRMGDLTKQMLAYAGRHTVDVRPVDLVALVHEVVGLLRMSISKRARLHLQVPSQPIVVEADQSQLVQVLMNLVVNASEALPFAGGTIEIGASIPERPFDATSWLDTTLPIDRLEGLPVAMLHVSDDGQGMTPELQRRIFDPFFTTKFSGRGLGLSAVLGIVRSHGGALRVDSALGKGTRFEIVLPLSRAPLERPATPPPRPKRLEGTRLLLVEDERIVRDTAARILRQAGASVTETRDGDEAVRTFERDPAAFDLVLCDMTMPGRDGGEICRALVALEPNLRFVVMSGHDREETLAKLAGCKLAGFVSKPFASNDLLQAVADALAQPR